MRRALFFLIACLLAAIPANAEGQVSIESVSDVDWEKLSLSERLKLRIPQEVNDEFLPNPGIRLRFHSELYRDTWGENYFDTEEWLDLEDDGISAMADALRHVGEIEVKESEWFQGLTERAENWFDLRIATFFRRDGQDQPKDLEVEVTIDGQKKPRNWGINFSHLDNPRPFVRFGHRPRQEIRLSPAREKIEWYFRDMPKDLDLKLKLDYDEDIVLELRFLGSPFGLELPKNWGGGFSVYHNFDRNNTGLELALWKTTW